MTDPSKKQVKKLEKLEAIQVKTEQINQALADEKFYRTAQNEYTNALVSAGLKNAKVPDESRLGTGIIELEKYLVKITEYAKQEGNGTTACILFTMLNQSIYEGKFVTGLNTAYIDLKEFMKRRGITDETKARRQIKKDLYLLNACTIEQRKTNADGVSDFIVLGVGANRYGISNNQIFFDFRPEWIAHLNRFKNKMMFAYTPKSLYAVEVNKNPNSFHFGMKIVTHKRINLGKANDSTLGVNTLLESSPDSRKMLEAVRAGHKKRYAQEILEPFERDMDRLAENDIGISWHYRGDTPKNRREFIQAMIEFEIKNYPDNEETRRLKTAKAKRAKKPARARFYSRASQCA